MKQTLHLMKKRVLLLLSIILTTITAWSKTWTLQNDKLCLDFNDETACFSVCDLRNGELWCQTSARDVVVKRVKRHEDRLQISLHGKFDFVVNAKLVDNAGLQLLISANKKAKMQELHYPAAFSSGRNDDYILLTDGAGLMLPVSNTTYPLGEGMTFFGGGGLSMPWMGVMDHNMRSGYMVIADTPFDVRLNLKRQSDNMLAIEPIWLSSMQHFSYNRSLTYYFFDRGGYVAQCKRYRDKVWRERKMLTLHDKIKAMPKIEQMLGAPHIYVWDDGRQLSVAQEMKSMGINKALFLWDGNHGAYPAADYDDSLRCLGYASGSYQLFSDLHKEDTVFYQPDTVGPLRYKNGVFPGEYKTLAARKADGTTYGNIYGTYACPTVMKPQIRQRMNRELREYPHDCILLDVYQCNGLYECYSPSHPTSREGYAKAIINNYKVFIDEYGLYTGGEWGADFVTPYSSFVHGMMTLQWPWWHYANQWQQKEGTVYYYGNWDNEEHPSIQVSTSLAAPTIMDWSMNEILRVPLYELVYHDAVVTSWRWEDNGNHNPEIWWKKDLFNILYGSAPLWSIDKNRWEAFKLTFAESYKKVCPWLNQIAYDEMTNHEFVSPDRKVQLSEFSSGKSVVVNFSDQDYVYNGHNVKAHSYLQL